MIGHEFAQRAHGGAVGSRKHAAHQHPGDAQRRVVFMALQTAVSTNESWLDRWVLLQRVEDGALLRIVGRNLHEWLAGYPPNRDRIVEKQSPRICRANDPLLQAGL